MTMFRIFVALAIIMLTLQIAPSSQADGSRFGSWEVFNKEDRISGDVSWYAASSQVAGDPPMSWPRKDIGSSVVVRCEQKSQDLGAYLWFSDKIIPDGYSSLDFGTQEYTARVRWDDISTSLNLKFYDVAVKAMFAVAPLSMITRLASSNSLLVELHMYDDGRVYYEYTLSGSSKAIAYIKEKCGITS